MTRAAISLGRRVLRLRDFGPAAMASPPALVWA